MAAVWPGKALGYAWMIQHGYAACATCHADPSGGSLLTRYGRAQGELLLRTRYEKRVPGQEVEPGKVGDFLFGAFQLPEALLLGGDFRLMYFADRNSHGWAYFSNFGFKGTVPAYGSWMAMQQDVVGQVTYKRVRAYVSLGYARDSSPGANDFDALAAITRTSPDRMISRVHWIGVDLGEDNQWLIRGGRMNLPFGLRLIEHAMWVRNITRTDVDAQQQDGVSVSYTSPKLRGEAMVILGNYQVAPDSVRERGYSAFVEWGPVEKVAIGASSLITHDGHDLQLATPLWRQAHGLFGRWSPLKGLALLGELDYVLFSQPPGSNNSGVASMLQGDYELVHGLHAMLSWETLSQQIGHGNDSFSTGIWGTLVWFFAPHADVRFDVVWHNMGTSAPRQNDTMLLAQLHLFL